MKAAQAQSPREIILMDSWLSFLSTLIWQGIVLGALIIFRGQLRGLIERLASLKHGTTEVVFQELSSKALEPSETVGKALEIRDEEGFFTRHGIEGLVQELRYLDPGEAIIESMLVFRTPRQQTWLVSTNKHVFFILDDERTRASQRLVQRRQDLEESLPVTTRADSELSGVFQLGVSGFWYYSIALLGPPGTARRRLERFLSTARA